jgi:hypothetical protein
MRTLMTILAATLLLGTASAVLADDGTDPRLDTSRYGGPVIQQQASPIQFSSRNVSVPREQVKRANQDNGLMFTSSNVSLPQSSAKMFDHAGANHDNGGN